jgi:hypothetical protein
MELNTIYFMSVDKGVFFNTLNVVLFSFLYKHTFIVQQYLLYKTHNILTVQNTQCTYCTKHTMYSIISDTDFCLFYKVGSSCCDIELKFQQL